MTWMLDTNIAIHLRDGDPAVTAALGRLDGAVLLSVVTRVELESGVTAILRAPARAGPVWTPSWRPFPSFRWDEAADAYRAIVEQAGYSRRKLLDRMIAAQAVVCRAGLVTRNADDFQDIPGLRLEAW